MGLTAGALRDKRNWLVLNDCSNACNTGIRTTMLPEVVNGVPALTPFAATCYGLKAADVLLRLDFGETRTIACSSGVQQGNPIGPAMVCLGLRPWLKRFLEEFEGEGMESFSCWMISRPYGGHDQHGWSCFVP